MRRVRFIGEDKNSVQTAWRHTISCTTSGWITCIMGGRVYVAEQSWCLGRICISAQLSSSVKRSLPTYLFWWLVIKNDEALLKLFAAYLVESQIYDVTDHHHMIYKYLDSSTNISLHYVNYVQSKLNKWRLNVFEAHLWTLICCRIGNKLNLL